jgi:hypothetical protein
VTVDIHQQPGSGLECWAFEVADPHTKELLAMHVDPTRPAGVGLPLASDVCDRLRGVLIDLLDPDPF